MERIKIKNIWKKYKLGSQTKLTEVISNLISGKRRKDFWALKNINLTVKEGEVLGIIGPNGGGKSTLLRIMAGVTYPTKGIIKTSGKIASLLDLGSGFHYELSGRENLYLYGSILGINRKTINKAFDEIVDFSGIGEFIDTPVKHYSSGMYVRLAFSIATQLEFDILLIDEILSVGDMDFQKKSYAKIKEIIKNDKTVVIVSHNLESISALCNKLLLVSGGEIIRIGPCKEIIEYYQKEL